MLIGAHVSTAGALYPGIPCSDAVIGGAGTTGSGEILPIAAH
ncbi:MAG: hypothetical protein WBB30_05370 [Solirubrobacterales bacterium]